jgi:alkaline phosphatase
VPHAIYRVDEKGEIKQEIPFPAELLPNETRFGLEGITTVGEGDDLTLWSLPCSASGAMTRRVL